MKQQWEERLLSVDSLEQEMHRVKETFASKVKTLTEEKHRAEEQAQYQPHASICVAVSTVLVVGLFF
jgi:F0F1-type ATP synthase assembly protein I